MPKRENAPVGAPCWVDLMTSDTEQSAAFYERLFGWTADEPAEGFGGYFNFRKDDVRVAGCMQWQADMPGSAPANVWSVYLATDDARKTVELASAHGGEVIVPAMDVGDLGTMAVVSDPSGAVIGMWQPKVHTGFGLLTEAGAPGWFELHTRDYERAVQFYRDVFRWETQTMGDTDEFRYTTLKHGDDMLAGIMDASAFLPTDVPSHWSVYFGSDDADATLAKTVELGGGVVQDAEDTPYGRLATATDSTGAVFKLVAPNEAMPARDASS